MKLSENFGALKHGLSVAVFFILSCLCAFAEDLRVRISPSRVIENQMAHFNIYCDNGEQIRSIAFPQIDGLTWHTNVSGSQTNIINGKVSASRSIGFTVSATGEIAIPKIRVETSEGERFTQAVKFTVGKLSTGMFRKDGSEMPLDEAVFLHVQLQNPERKLYFVGEEIPIYVVALARPDISVSLTATPELGGNAGEIFTATERGAVRRELNLQGETYNASVFLFDLRAMKTGQFPVDFSATATCLVGEERDPFEESFLGGNFRVRGLGLSGGNRVPVPLKGSLKSVTILPRPPVPAGAIDLGIISENQPTWTLSSETPKQGDPLYLDLDLAGNTAGLIPPEPKIEGFRTYPAEVSPSDSGKTRVRMMLIPLDAGEQKLSVTFAILNPRTQKYTLTRIEKTLQIEKNTTIAAPATTAVVPLEDTPARETLPAENAALQNIAYIRPLTAKSLEAGKTAPGKNLWMPFAGTLVTLLACGSMLIFRSRRNDDPAAALRKRARNRKSEVLKKLTESTPDNFDALVRNEVSDYLADAKGLISTDALRDSLKKSNAELAEVLDSAESAGYRPNARCEHFEKFRATVIRAVKTGAFIAVAGIVGLASPQDALAADAPVAVEQKILDAESAYANGNFEKAREGFSELSEIAPYAPDVWFNLGNTLYQQKQFAAALACYERAWRLDVGRSDILANLNAARVKLKLPLLNEVKNPADFFVVLRDSFSPFTWTLFACGALIAGMLVITFVRRKRLVTGTLAVLVFGFCMANFLNQQKTLRDTTAALVVADNAAIYSLPIKGNAAVRELAALPAGTSANILEARDGWYLIRLADGAEGWIEKSALARIWE